MITVAGTTIYAAAWLMSLLGFSAKLAPIEVTYDPYDDGSTLESLIDGDQPPLLAPLAEDSAPPQP